MSMKETRAHLSPTEGIAHLPAFPEEQYAILFRHGTLTVGLYAPRGKDIQTPHTRDEVYVVVQGRGTYVHGDTRRAFTPGDLLFVPAHVPHHFEDFTDDLVVWVLFYGPEGGERG
jgi:mannose-6-phosphate isomerase-like protein (cupin superfamily)